MDEDKVKEITDLLDRVESLTRKDYQKTAYSYLIDYSENPEWVFSHEGERLVGLCIEILKSLEQDHE